jgi:hypothetical protein
MHARRITLILLPVCVFVPFLLVARQGQGKQTKGGKTPELVRPAGAINLKYEQAVSDWISKQKADSALNKHVEPVLIKVQLLQAKEMLNASPAKPFELAIHLSEKDFVFVVEKGKVSKDLEDKDFWTWLGRIKGIEGSSVTISCSDRNHVNGSIRTPDEVYEIRAGPKWEEKSKQQEPPLHVVVLVNDMAFPPSRLPDPPEPVGPPIKEKSSHSRA